MKTHLLVISLFLSFTFSFLFFSSCNGHESITDPTLSGKLMKDTLNYFSLCDPSYLMQLQTATYDTIFSEIEIDSSYVPDGPDCAYIQHGWITHHYEPKDGKLVGVWPLEFTQSNLIVLRTKYGYKGIYCLDGSQYNLATNPTVGFSKDNLMLAISYDNGHPEQYLNKLNNYDCRYYYIDEAVNHACMDNEGKRLYHDWEIYTISNDVHSIRPFSYFVNSGYKTCSHLDFLTQYSDIIMYPSYKEWKNPIINYWPCYTNMSWGPATEKLWVVGDEVDQRPSWTVMRNKYGAKFSMTWINTKEIGEFDLLFGHAKNKGLNGVWIYGYKEENGQPVPHYNDQWANISYAAWKNGFLRRWVQDVVITWRCSLPNCGCNPSCFPNDYYIDNISYGTVMEVLP